MTGPALIELCVRIGLVILFFPFSALDKIISFGHAVKQAEEVFPRTLAILLILVGLSIEIFASLGVISGVADRLAAVVLALYCVATAVLFKRWWKPGDFWSDPGGKARTLFWDFLKNFSLAAGFLLIVVGPRGDGLLAFLSDPFGSSHPYASAGHHGADQYQETPDG